MAAGRRTDPDEPGVDDGLGEVGVLGQEAVAGVHGVGARAARDVEQLLDVEVGLAARLPFSAYASSATRTCRASRSGRRTRPPRRCRRPCRRGRRGRRSRRGWRSGSSGLFFGITAPSEYGGADGDFTSLCIAIEELGRVDQSIGITLSAGVGLGITPIATFGTAEQKERYLPDLVAGRALAAFGLTEPEAGSDAGASRTTARLDGDEWVVDGAKAFITNSGTDMTSVVTVTARTGTREDGSPEISAILVPSGTPGFTVEPAYDKLGWHASDTHGLSLLLDEGTFVEDALLANASATDLPADGVVTGTGGRRTPGVRGGQRPHGEGRLVGGPHGREDRPRHRARAATSCRSSGWSTPPGPASPTRCSCSPAAGARADLLQPGALSGGCPRSAACSGPRRPAAPTSRASATS
jgi:hypothetical protein